MHRAMFTVTLTNGLRSDIEAKDRTLTSETPRGTPRYRYARIKFIYAGDILEILRRDSGEIQVTKKDKYQNKTHINIDDFEDLLAVFDEKFEEFKHTDVIKSKVANTVIAFFECRTSANQLAKLISRTQYLVDHKPSRSKLLLHASLASVMSGLK